MEKKRYLMNLPKGKRCLKAQSVSTGLWFAIILFMATTTLLSSHKCVAGSSNEILNVYLQQTRITGVITDAATGETLPGVNVVWEGTTVGTVTDMQGRYSLETTVATTRLAISMVGYLSEVIDVEGRTTLDISLIPDIRALDEFVVVGYSSQTRASLSTAVSTVKGEELAARSTGDVRKALQGLVPGLAIIDQGGAPGQEDINLRIRGFTSINNTNPLVLVDGVEQNLNSVDVNAIESITVLKDAASTAIYGSRGANGVIIITTKTGSAGKINLTYNTFYGTSNATIRPTSINTRDYMEMQNLSYVNSNVNFTPYPDIDGYLANMEKYPELFPKAFPEWDELFSWAPTARHSLVATGGTENIKSMFNMAYEDQGSVIPGNASKIYRARSNNEIKLHDNVRSFVNLSVQRNEALRPNSLNQWYYQLLFEFSEFQNRRYPDGSYGFSDKGENVWYMTDLNYAGRVNTTIDNAVMNVGAEIDIFKGLQYKFAYMVNTDREVVTSNSPRFQLVDFWNENRTVANRDINDYNERRRERFRTTLNSILTYNTNINQVHEINALAGYSEDEFRLTGINAGGSNFYNNDLRNLAQGDPELRSIGNVFADWGLRSFFGRIAYAYDNKIFVEANSRYDGSSRFPEGSKYTLFPSASAAWRLSEEGFWDNIRPIINEFKLRYSYGVNGNQNIGNYTYIPQLYLSNNYAFYNSGSGTESLVTGIGMNDLASTELTWETTKQHNIGLDMAFLDNRLSVTLELFDKVTDGILLDVPVPAVIGLNPSLTNAGILSNKGFETQISWRNQTGEFRYGITANASYVVDVLEDFGGLPRQIMFRNRYYRAEGTPLFALYGFQFDGYYVDQDDIDNSPARGNPSGLFPGDMKYKDLSGPDGEPDGIITNDDMIDLGYGTPRYFFGTNINFDWRGLDFNMFWQGAAGHHVPVFGKIIEGGGYGGWTPQFAVGNTWTGPDDVDARFPVVRRNPGNNIQASDKWLESGSYLRLKSVTIGYTLPSQWMRGIPVESFRIYVNAINPVTFSRLSSQWGLDPEGSIGNLRYDYFPQIKSYNAGLVVNF
jgi:TonB-linked SusC/RagA family outer membrane protein